ncbi:hypothetical protein KFE25_009927 [Diacronema lutheri]|uniref:Uncharacterized protein n=1 Tax=Diacronema lutheri TaxID=2081491 RepID=A0A8J6C9G9_DIALT|nr:hypothetical protein KFE25_009927 [Diacronema lutheri]
MNRFQFVGAQDFMVPCDASLVFALEGRRELGRCVFDGSACFVLRAAARRGQQVEVICFSAGEELTPELGCDSKPASLDVELDSTQFKCELANLATPAGPALVCLLDGSAAFQIDLGRVTALLDGGDVSSAEAEAAADAPPLPPFVQLEFGPVAFRLYASLATPSNGEGSLAHMHACVVELLRFARSMRPAAQPGRDATSGRDAADLDALLDELSRADGYDAFRRGG